MSFLYPAFLWAFVILSIPIIIHLFNFRKVKNIGFSNVKMLEELYVIQQKKSQLKNILILISRLLFFTFLIFAFAQPIFKNQNIAKEKIKSTIIYIDNSLSMGKEYENIILLEKAKQIAQNIIKNSSINTKFNIITSELDINSSRFYHKKTAITMIDNITLSNKTQTFENILNLIKLNQENELNNIYFISDFQKSNYNINNIKDKYNNIDINFLQVQSVESGNIYIDSLWFLSPNRIVNKSNNLVVRITNQTDENANGKLELYINDKLNTFTNWKLNKKSSQDIELNFTSNINNINKCKVKISNYGEITQKLDDEFYFNFNNSISSNVMIISENISENYKALYHNDNDYYTSFYGKNNVKLNEINKYHCIVLQELNEISSGIHNEIINYIKSGGTLIVIPGSNIDIQSYNNLLLKIDMSEFSNKVVRNQLINKIDIENPLFKNLFKQIPKNVNYPSVNSYYAVNKSNNKFENELLKFNNNQAYLLEQKYGNGKIYLFTASQDEANSNFLKNSMFVYVNLKIMENSGLYNNIFNYFEDKYITIRNISEERLTLKDPKSNINHQLVIRENNNAKNIEIPQKLVEANNYSISNHDNAIACLSINYDRKESIFEYHNILKLGKVNTFYKNNDIIKFDEKIINKKINDSEIDNWKWFLLFSLLFLITEIIIVKFIK